jgi:sarcosine oxidase subunit alpha
VEKIECDILAMSGGWDPNLHLYSQLGNKIQYDLNSKWFLSDDDIENQYMIGSCMGLVATQDCLGQGFQTMLESLRQSGIEITPKQFNVELDPYLYDQTTISDMISSGSEESSLKRKQFVDFQLDVTSRDIDIALEEGFESIQHVKRYTTANQGTDQGKISGTNLAILIAQKTGKEISEIGPTTFRPPYTPITFGAIAGRSLLDQFDPVRQTSIHDWHVRAGAEFENVGQWKRPWFYPKANETIDDAVIRECLAVRNSVGICDASTLGKIEINGPDSAEFLNRVYVNNWSKLQIGRCRYGLMLGDDGNVMDDGVTAKIGENKYLMHTTTSGAATVMDWLERWLQTEWPELKVYLTSVTDQWSTISINGPNSRKVLGKLCDDIELSNESFPFMSFKAGTVSNVNARVFRVSFAGELSYEINVDSEYGSLVWQAIMDAGREFCITPYGTESMHVLRAEKGYVIVGQDTDGSVTPVDLGYGKMLSKTKDFLGKRSLDRKEMVRSDRKQFVGLMPFQSSKKIPEGAQIVESLANQSVMIGHVTSSYFSPILDKYIALALIQSGRNRKGEYVYAIDTKGGKIKSEIVNPVFYDSKGDRQNV